MKSKLFFSLFLVIASLTFSIGQVQSLDQQFKEYKILQLNAEDYLNTISTNRSDILNTSILGVDVQLHTSAILNKNYKLRVSTKDGIQEVRTKRAIPMQGTTNDGGRVSLTFNDDFIYGFIDIKGERTYIEPLSHFDNNFNNLGSYVIYKVKDVIETEHKTCGVTKEMERMSEMNAQVENQGERMPGQCLEVDYALASDWLMFNSYGSIANVENHNIGVTNDVQTNYDDEFSDEVQLLIVEQFISTCNTCDPWTNSTAAGVILNSFRSWGPSGFAQIHDIGSLWTDRNFDGSTVGIAYVGVVCAGSRYNCLMDFTNNANSKRVMVAHEIGHNFSSFHDSGGGFIMSPSVNNTTVWSTQSINAVENHIASRWCLSTCQNSSAPVADFDWDVIEDCAPGEVEFEDLSQGTVTAWLWDFPGGTPTTSTQQNPTVTYDLTGSYDVTLTVFNGGLSDVITIGDAITITDQPEAEFDYLIDEDEVTFENLSVFGDTYYWDFGDGNSSIEENPVHIYVDDGVYNVFLFVTNACGTTFKDYLFTIATLPEAKFTGSPLIGCNSHVVSFESQASSNTDTYFWEFEEGNPNSSTLENPVVQYDIPGAFDVKLTVYNLQGEDTKEKVDFITINESPVADYTYTTSGTEVTFVNQSTGGMTYSWTFGDGMTSSDENPVHTYATGGDYIVTLVTSNSNCPNTTKVDTVNLSLAPQALIGIVGSPEGCLVFDAQFEDLSTNDPTSWTWTFPGGIPNTSTSKDPVISYENVGTYDVTLIATNALGADTLTLPDFIIVKTFPTTDFTSTQDQGVMTFSNMTLNGDAYEWDFGDGNMSIEENPVHDYGGEGTWTVILTATNECGSFSQTQQVTTILSPVAAIEYNANHICGGNTISFMDNSQNTVTSRLWTFEGGSPATSVDANPIVTYNTPGTYSVTLEVSNSVGSDSETIMNAVTVLDLPSASFTMSQAANLITYTYTGNPNDDILWTLPDGSTSMETVVNYTVPENGNYEATLSASNICGGDSEMISTSINAYPDATFALENNQGCAPMTLELSALEIEGATYSWVINGGNPATSMDREVTVEYTERGSYDVMLTVSNTLGSDTETITNGVVVNDVPTSEFTLAYDGATLTTTNTSEFATTYLWDFGDSNTSVDANPTHQYQMDGTYIVTLNSTNECGTITSTMELDVVVLVPGISFESSAVAGCAPLEVVYTDMTTNDPTTFDWSFDGGFPSTSIEQNPTVVYNTAGTFDVSVTMTNAAGTSSLTLTDHITVEDVPTTSFDTSTPVDGMVDFTNTTSGTVTSYSWDFGDGMMSDEANPSHIYASSGTYTVILTATNDCGSKTFTTMVTVMISSVGNIDGLTSINVYPNPFNEDITLNVEFNKSVDVKISVLDNLGRSLKSMNLDNASQINERIEAGDLPSGLYIIKVMVGKQSIITKMVKN